MNSHQLILFDDEKIELSYLKEELKSVKKQLDNVRRGLFARHSELIKKYSTTLFELETLKRDLCRNTNNFQDCQSSRNDSDKVKIVCFSAI